MLLLSGALVSGPYALITTAVSADLVSHMWLPLLRDSTVSVGEAPSPVCSQRACVLRVLWHLSLATLPQLSSYESLSGQQTVPSEEEEGRSFEPSLPPRGIYARQQSRLTLPGP